ncbi:MAG: hypothetical protein ACRDZ8_16725 [Acidimicrobiales bacterium]
MELVSPEPAVGKRRPGSAVPGSLTTFDAAQTTDWAPLGWGAHGGDADHVE